MNAELLKRLILTTAAVILLLVSCSQPAPEAETSTFATIGAEEQPAAESRILPTLYPTTTIYPTPLPTNTVPPQEVGPTSTPIDFEQLVVDLRYSIPLIGLDRTLSGDVSGRLKVIDQANTFTVEQRNQAGVLLELQQSLPELELSDLPEGCEGCVWLEYELPLTGDRDEGWLQDARMLVSLENFSSNVVGPHFPPGTTMALRRSSSPYHNAHTIAFSSSGQLWSWTAIDGQIAEATLVAPNDPLLSVAFDQAEIEQFEDLYTATCPDRVGFETLYIKSGETERFIDIVCPELSLPHSLLPLYVVLADKTEGLGIEDVHDEYSPPLPQEILLHYANPDGQSLTVFYDGRSFAAEDGRIIVSDTITLSQVISMTDQLLDIGLVRAGAGVFLSGSASNTILVRGPVGIGEIFWDGEPPAQLEQFIALLDRWLADRLPSADGQQETGEAGEASPTATPTPGG